MTGSEVQNQTEYSKEQDKSTNTEKKINGIVIE
jgi:hypothetical protein